MITGTQNGSFQERNGAPVNFVRPGRSQGDKYLHFTLLADLQQVLSIGCTQLKLRGQGISFDEVPKGLFLGHKAG